MSEQISNSDLLGLVNAGLPLYVAGSGKQYQICCYYSSAVYVCPYGATPYYDELDVGAYVVYHVLIYNKVRHDDKFISDMTRGSGQSVVAADYSRTYHEAQEQAAKLIESKLGAITEVINNLATTTAAHITTLEAAFTSLKDQVVKWIDDSATTQSEMTGIAKSVLTLSKDLSNKQSLLAEEYGKLAALRDALGDDIAAVKKHTEKCVETLDDRLASLQKMAEVNTAIGSVGGLASVAGVMK